MNFDLAKESIRTWQGHLFAGATVFPDHFGDGETIVVVIPVGPFRVLAPCRIIYVIDDKDRFGFAYGTLPGHPESGEEAFLVEREGPESLTFVIRAFSRPAELYVKAIGPLARRIQNRTTSRYLDGLSRYAAWRGTGDHPR